MAILPYRLEDGVYASPIHEFEHETRPGMVSLVGTFHTGTPEYYAQLTGYVNGRADSGSMTHYESIGIPSDEELAACPDWVRPAIVALGKTMLETSDNPGGPGIRSQMDTGHFDMHPSGEVHDMNFAQIFMAMGERAATLFAKGFLDELEDEPVTPEMLEDIAIFKDVFVNQRNAVEIAAADASLARNPNLTIVWGVEHIPGFGDALLQRKYRLVRTLWLVSGLGPDDYAPFL